MWVLSAEWDSAAKEMSLIEAVEEAEVKQTAAILINYNFTFYVDRRIDSDKLKVTSVNFRSKISSSIFSMHYQFAMQML